jgi:hypothetical protein
MDFYSLFLDFLVSWTERTNTGKSRGISARNPRHMLTAGWTVGSILKTTGSLL